MFGSFLLSVYLKHCFPFSNLGCLQSLSRNIINKRTLRYRCARKMQTRVFTADGYTAETCCNSFWGHFTVTAQTLDSDSHCLYRSAWKHQFSSIYIKPLILPLFCLLWSFVLSLVFFSHVPPFLSPHFHVQRHLSSACIFPDSLPPLPIKPVT